MKNRKNNILVIDDHPINSDAYINLIKSRDEFNETIFHKATDCYTAFKLIKQAEITENPFDVALIDISIPEYREEKLLSGTDVAILIRNTFPDCIIIMLTMHNESLVLFNAYKQVNPEGFISKNDIDFEMFPEIFDKIVNVENYFSTSINNAIQQLLKNALSWDEFDTQILLFLEKGIQTKDLPEYINLSLSTIEKRKAAIKTQIFNKKVTDKELIAKCKLLNFI
jgi:DNA-binding NarL/FixJ family response regulator